MCQLNRISNAAFYKYIPAAWAEPEVRNCRMAATAGAAKACLAATCSDNIAMSNSNYFPLENPQISARNNILIMTEIQVARERSITKQNRAIVYPITTVAAKQSPNRDDGARS
jgi:hypothetical protein